MGELAVLAGRSIAASVSSTKDSKAERWRSDSRSLQQFMWIQGDYNVQEAVENENMKMRSAALLFCLWMSLTSAWPSQQLVGIQETPKAPEWSDKMDLRESVVEPLGTQVIFVFFHHWMPKYENMMWLVQVVNILCNLANAYVVNAHFFDVFCVLKIFSALFSL